MIDIAIRQMLDENAMVSAAAEAHERGELNFRDVRGIVNRVADQGRPLQSAEVKSLLSSTANWEQGAEAVLDQEEKEYWKIAKGKARGEVAALLMSRAVEALPHVVMWLMDEDDFGSHALGKLVRPKYMNYHDYVAHSTYGLNLMAHNGVRVLQLEAEPDEILATARELGLDMGNPAHHAIVFEACRFPHRIGEIKAAIEKVKRADFFHGPLGESYTRDHNSAHKHS